MTRALPWVVLLLACGGPEPRTDSDDGRYLDPLVGGPEPTTPTGTVPTNAGIQIYAMVINLSEQGPLEVRVVDQESWTVAAGAVGAPALLTESPGATVELRDALGAVHDTQVVRIPELGEILFVLVPHTAGRARLVPFTHASQPSGQQDHVFRVAHAAPDASSVALSLGGLVPAGGNPFDPGATVDQAVAPADDLGVSVDALPTDGVPELEASADAGDSGGSWVFLVDRPPLDGTLDAAWRWRTNGTPGLLQ